MITFSTNPFRAIPRWLQHRWPGSIRSSRQPDDTAKNAGHQPSDVLGARLADINDLLQPEFGKSFRSRLPNEQIIRSPRKLWEFAWIAQQFDNLRLSGGCFLGLGVGYEQLIFHFCHLAQSVIATDLYTPDTAWSTARFETQQIFERSYFPYPRERLTVQNMDMRRLDYPANTIDAVWSCSSVEHVQTLPQFVQIFREIHRVLKPGGVAVITTEFSLAEPYFLPGVLSLWRDSALFHDRLQGLSLEGRVDLRYRAESPGNRPTPRRNVNHPHILYDFSEGPMGPTSLCIHVGYTQTIPVALVFRKTSPSFAWPEYLGAPAWYEKFARGVETFLDHQNPQEAVPFFEQALQLAQTPGARLHCYRYLLETFIHLNDIERIQNGLGDFQQEFPNLPDDDDALDMVGLIASLVGQKTLAQRCWERAVDSPAALPISRLRTRLRQLEAQLAADPASPDVRHLHHLAEAALLEANGFRTAVHEPEDPVLRQLRDQLQTVCDKSNLRRLTTL